MNDIYTFVPEGDVKASSDMLGLGRWFLWMTQQERARRGIDSLPSSVSLYDGQVTINVIARANGDSIVNIYTEPGAIPAEDKYTHRERLLHLRLVLTLAEEPSNDGDPADGTVGWPYQKDPSFIAVEPIPVKEDEEDKVYLHVLFEVDKQQGLMVEGLNGEEHLDAVDDVASAGRGDQGRKLSMEDARTLIEAATGYQLVAKVRDSDTDEVIPILPIAETYVPSEEAISGTTEFNKLMSSSVMTHRTETLTLDGYEYLTNFSGNLRSMSNGARHIREPLESEKSTFIYDDSDNTIPATFHTISNIAGYSDTIEEPEGGDNPSTPQNEGNIHPVGNINEEVLRQSYGTVLSLTVPFRTITTDFTPRVDDAVFIGDIGSAATRKKTIWYDYLDSNGDIQRIFPDAKLTSVFFPYYIEEKDWETLASNYLSYNPSWGYYTDHPTRFILSGANDEFTGSTPIDYSFSYDPSKDFYDDSASNWLLHPFRNEAWGNYLIDVYDMDDTTLMDADMDNPLFADSSRMIDPLFVWASIPNRMILCIRQFFANTDNGTSFAGTRREYNVEFYSAEVATGKYGHRVPVIQDADWDNYYGVPGTYTEVPAETSPPLTIEKAPNFVTEKGDLVAVYLLSSIYAVCDFPAVSTTALRLSPRHEDIPLVYESTTPQSTVTTTRHWPEVLDGNWEYTNIYSSGIAVSFLADEAYRYGVYSIEGDVYPKRLINSGLPFKFIERATRGESIYSDDDEDTQYRYVPDEEQKIPDDEVTWREEDTPESHLVHCIYRALIAEGYDRHHPVCDIRLEANLYDKYVTVGEA